MTTHNLFGVVPGAKDGERVIPLLERSGIRVERILSYGHPSPADYWYDQEDDEWVALLCGTAALEFEEGRMVKLKAGDFLEIERHVKHRVESVSEDAVWLAVHYGANSS